MTKKIVTACLAAMFLAVVVYIWTPDGLITYHGRDLLMRIAMSVMVIGIGGSRLMRFWDNW